MKLKKILAGALAAVMVLASVPATGLNASAAETTVIDTLTLSMSAEPVMGGQASNFQIIAEGADAGKAVGATTYTGDEYNLTGSTPFLIRFQMKLNAKTNKTGAPGAGSFDTFLSNTCYNMQMNDQYLALYCNAADNSWPTMQYSISSIDDFIGKWHDIVAVYCGQKFVLFVDGTKAVFRGSTNTESGIFNLKASGASSISLGVNGFNANFADFAMYTGTDNVSGISGSSTIADVNTLLANKTAAAAPIEGTGNFVAEPTVWTKDDSKVSTFASGIYVGTTKLVAKNGYTFSSSMTLPEGFEATVSEDGKTATVTVSYTVENDVASTALAIKEGTPYANSWYETTGTTGDGGASWAFDKNADGLAITDTHWHSNWGTATETNIAGQVSENHPIYIQAGFEEAKNVIMISYMPRQDQETAVNVIGNYEVLAANSTEVKPSDEEFVSVCKGTFEATKDEQKIRFPYAVNATHIRIQATSSIPEANTYVTASHIDMYEKANAQGSDVKNIVSLEGKAAVENADRGTVTVSPKNGLEGVDTQVTLKATAKEGYHFVRWEVTGGETAPEGSSVQVTVNSTDSKVYTAVFEEGADPYYKESAYWDKEEAGDTISTQDENDIWYYQIKNADGWSRIDSQYYYPASADNENFGRWLQNGSGSNDTFYYGKISKEQLTTNLTDTGYVAVGYAWKAGAKGYYSAALESAVGAGNGVALHVSHASKDALTADGKELYTGTMSKGSTIDNCRIAKAEAGDYIRIYGTIGNTWVTGFKPMIVKETAKDYATQYLADLAAQNINTEDYTTETAAAYTTAKTNLEAAIAEGVTTTEDDITAKIEALEAAVAGLKEKVKFTGTTLTLDGKIGLTFYTNLTSLEGVTAASFTVDDTKKVDAAYELKNGYVACTYKLAAKEMTDEVSASITVNEETITSEATSAASNANALLNDTNSSDALKALVKSLLNYGAAAQVQFNYKNAESTLANASLADKTVPEIGTSLDATCGSMGVTAEGYKGLSLVLNSETALKLYASGETSIILKKDGTQVAASDEKKNNGFSFAKVENIAANHLQDTYTVVINNNEDTTYTVSPLLYCYKVANGEGFDTNLKNLVNALYDYNQKAIAYGNSQN